MGRRRRGEPPPYLLDRSTGQAYATTGRRKTYFGAHGSPESRYRYQRFLRQWERSHGRTVTATSKGTLAEAAADFLEEIRGRLSRIEYVDTKRTLDTLTARYGALEPDDFRPAQYKDLRKTWIDAGHTRHTIGKACGRVRRFFRWLVSEERAEPQTHAMLLAVMPLAPGAAPELGEIQPVPLRSYLRTLRHLGRHVRAMCRLQFWCGSRPGETCRIRGREIIRGGTVLAGRRVIRIPAGVWLFMPERHKKQRSGKPTIYILGPRCQAVLRPFLRDDPDAFLFRPSEARGEWEARKRERRKTSVQPSQQDRRKKRPLLLPGDCYSVSSYGRAIERAAGRAGVEHWNPHQLRHNAGVRIEAASDLLTAQAALSHERPETTLIYLQAKIESAATVARRLG